MHHLLIDPGIGGLFQSAEITGAGDTARISSELVYLAFRQSGIHSAGRESCQ